MNVFVNESRKLVLNSINGNQSQFWVASVREISKHHLMLSTAFYIPESKKLNNGVCSKKTHKSPDPSTVVTTFITRHKLN